MTAWVHLWLFVQYEASASCASMADSGEEHMQLMQQDDAALQHVLMAQEAKSLARLQHPSEPTPGPAVVQRSDVFLSRANSTSAVQTAQPH